MNQSNRPPNVQSAEIRQTQYASGANPSPLASGDGDSALPAGEPLPPVRPRIFISYSHDSDEHKRRVRELAARLRHDGLDCWIDQYDPYPAEGWLRWMQRQIREADFVLVVCTDRYQRCATGQEIPGIGLGVMFESVLLVQELYDNTMYNTRFICVLFLGSTRENIPTPLRQYTYYQDVEAEAGYHALLDHLTGRSGVAPPELGELRRRPTAASLPLPTLLPVEVLREISEAITHELAREQAEPLGIPFDPAARPISDESELLASRVKEHAPGSERQPLAVLLGRDALRSFLLLGDPGAGKTSLLRQIALFELRRLQVGEEGALLPVYVRLFSLRGDTPLETLVIDTVQGLWPDTYPDQIRSWLSQGRVRLLLDGLNELPGKEYERCQAEILNLMQRYRRSAFVVTDRPNNIDRGVLPVPVFRVCDWDEGRIRHFVCTTLDQLASPHPPDLLLARIEREPNLRSLVTNPLSLGILTGLYADTGEAATMANRGNLVERFVDKLFERERRAGLPGTAAAVQRRMLQAIAFRAVAEGVTSLGENPALAEIVSTLATESMGAQLPGASASPRATLEALTSARWLRLDLRSQRIQFRYLALQEYFAAAELRERWRREESLAAYIADARFEEEVVLLANLLGEADRFLDEVRRIGGVQLAGRCAIGAPATPARARIIELLIQELSSNVKLRRSKTASKFIFLRVREAVPALLAALDDASGAVRWNAAFAIEKTIDPAETDHLFASVVDSTERSDVARIAACQALGRSSSPIAVRALFRALDDASRKVSQSAASALAGLRDPIALTLLEKAAAGEGGNHRIQATALRVLSLGQQPATASLARAALAHPSSQVRREARVALGRAGDLGIVEAAIRKAQEGPHGARAAAIRELADMGPVAAPAVQPLWTLLHEGELQHELVGALRRIGGPQVRALAMATLRAPDPALRRLAVKIVGYTRDEWVLEALVAALRDPDNTVAFTATEYLAHFGNRAVPLIAYALASGRAPGENDWSHSLLQALRSIGTRLALQLLIEVAEGSQPKATIASRYLQGSELDPEAVRLLLKERWTQGLGTGSASLAKLYEELNLRYHLGLALEIRHAADPESWRELEEDVRSPISIVRKTACAALVESEESRAWPILQRIAAHDPSSEVRAMAIRGLLHAGTQGAQMPAGTLAVWSIDPTQPLEVRVASIQALAAIGDRAAQSDLKVLARGNDDPQLAAAAAASVSTIEVRLRGGSAAYLLPPWRMALLGEALRSRRTRERAWSAHELGNLPLAKVKRQLLGALDDSQAMVRLEAVHSLGRLRAIAAVGRLSDLLRDPDLQVRRAVILALREIGLPLALAALRVVAEDREQPVLRELAVESLASARELPEAYAALVAFLDDPDPRLQRRAGALLASLPPASFGPDHQQAIARGLWSEEPLARARTLAALPPGLPPNILARVLRLTTDGHPRVRSSALRALAAADAEAASESLSRAARDKDVHVALEVCKIGAAMSPEHLVPLLSTLLEHPLLVVRMQVLELIEAQRLGDETLAALIHATRDKRETFRLVQWGAVEVLGRLRVRAAAPVLAELVGHAPLPLRDRAAAALAQIGAEDVATRLLAYLRGPNPAVQETVIRLLPVTYLRESVPLLCRLLRSGRISLVITAAQALGEIEDLAAVIPLAQLARSSQPEIRHAALAALGRFPTTESINAIVWNLHHQDRYTADCAGAALALLVQRLSPEALAGLLRKPQIEARLAAARRLRELGSTQALVALVGVIDLADPELSREALLAFAEHRWWSPDLQQKLSQLIRLSGRLREALQEPIEAAWIAGAPPDTTRELLQLLEHRNPFVTEAACRIVGGVRAAQATRRLVVLLNSDFPHTRKEAAEALRAIASPEAAEELLTLLADTDVRVRATAARAMGEMRFAQAVDDLGEALKDPMEMVRRAAVEALGCIATPPAIERLAAAALDEDRRVREMVFNALANVPTDSPASSSAALGLCLLLEAPDPVLRVRGVEALAANHSPQALDGLLQAVRDQAPGVRQAALLALGRRTTGEHLDLLSDATMDPVPGVREAAQQAFERARLALLVRILARARRGRDEHNFYRWRQARAEVAPLLARLGAEWAVRALIERWRTAGSQRERREPVDNPEQILRVLGWLAATVTTEELRREIEQTLLMTTKLSKRELRVTAVVALGSGGFTGALETILRFARSNDNFEQQAAVWALVELDLPDSNLILRSLIGADQTAWTRKAVLEAVEEIEDFGARPLVLEALQEPDQKVRSAAIVALGKVGRAEDIPFLGPFLRDPDAATRRRAAISLRKLGAKEFALEFVALLRDPSLRVIEAAIRACRELNLLCAIEALVDLALYGPEALRDSAAEALAEMNEAATILYLDPLLCSPLGTDRALALLARLEPAETRERLVVALRNPEPAVRHAAVAALRRLPSRQQAAALLAPVLADNDTEVRRVAIEIVGEQELVLLFQPTLLRLLEDPEPTVRAQAALCLAKGEADQAVPALAFVAEREQDQGTQMIMFRALAHLDTPEARRKLAAWKATGAPKQRFRVVAAIQAERLREVVEATTFRSPSERLDDPNPYIRTAALREIGRRRLSEEAPRLLLLLRDPNPYVCQAAMLALAELGQCSASGPIAAIAGSESPWTRASVAEALGRLGDPSSVDVLLELFGDSDLKVRRAALGALLGVDHPRCREAAEGVLRAGNPTLAVLVAQRFGERADDQCTPHLLAGLNHPEETVRYAVVTQLEHRNLGPHELRGLYQVLEVAHSRRILQAALRAASRAGDGELAPLVARFLDHPDAFLRSEAARTLGAMYADAFAQLLIHATRDPEGHVAAAAATALGRLKSTAAIGALSDLLVHEDPPVVAAAIEALADIGTATAADALGQALSHPITVQRHRATQALSRFPPELAFAHLATAARDDNHYVRQSALEGLGHCATPAAVEVLAQALRDENSYVRFSAVDVLARIGTSAAVQRLQEAVEDAVVHVRLRAIRALGKAPDRELLNLLLRILEDEHPGVRYDTLSVLARIDSPAWLSAAAAIARHDPVASLRSLALRVLGQATSLGGDRFLRDFERELEVERLALVAPQLAAVAEVLEHAAGERDVLMDNASRAAVLEALTQAFASGLLPLRLQAARLLAHAIPHPEGLPVYAYAVQDNLSAVRKAAIRALARLGSGEAGALLCKRLASEEDAMVRAVLVAQASKLNDEALRAELLVRALSDPDRRVIKAGLEALLHHSCDDALGAMRALLDHSDAATREAAVNTLSAVGDRGAVTLIRSRLLDESWHVRQDAVRAIAVLGDVEAAFEVCRRGLEDPNLYVRLTSIQIVEKLRLPQAAPLLLGQLHYPHPTVRSAAVRALVPFLANGEAVILGPKERDLLAERLGGELHAETVVWVRIELIRALATWDPERAVPLLQPFLLRERTSASRRALLEVLTRAPEAIDPVKLVKEFENQRPNLPIRVRRDVSLFVRSTIPKNFEFLLPLLLRDEDDFVRANAAYALGKVEGKEALLSLQQLLDDPVRMVRDIAYAAIRRALPGQPIKETGGRYQLISGETFDGDTPAAVPMGSGASRLANDDCGSEGGLRSAHWIDRWYAVLMLSAEPRGESIELLRRVLEDETHETVREEAKRVVEQLLSQFHSTVDPTDTNGSDLTRITNEGPLSN